MRRFQDLPVSIDLPSRLTEEVTAFVETEAGWQVVGADGPPAPVLRIASSVGGGGPTVVVVDGAPGARLVRDLLLAGAVDVVAWPEDRQRLLEAPQRVVAAPTAARGPRLVRVGGAAGGAGTSTVALALGGLAAWSGRRALVVGDDDLGVLCGVDDWQGPGAVELAALDPDDAAAEVDGLALPVAGVPGLRCLGGGGAAVAHVAGWPTDVVVADRRVAAAAADLVVARPDACLRGVGGAPAVVVGDRPLDRAGVRRVLGRDPACVLPWSPRVARAGLRGRVPSALPGAWLRRLRPLAERALR